MPDLYPFQVEGARFLRQHHRCILGDQMGLGKTPQALRALTADHFPVVVVCPASVRNVWKQEAAIWRTRASVQVITNGRQEYNGSAITVISFALLGKVKMPRPKTMIVDEAHYCQSRLSTRTKTVWSSSKGINLWLLTGTPMWSRPRSIYPLLTMVGAWKHSYHEFAVKFCNGGYVTKPVYGRGYVRVWDDSGASNLDELADISRQLLLRRLKADVLDDLPAKTRQVITVNHRLSDEEKKVGLFDFNTLKGGRIPPGPIATAIRETASWKLKSINDHIETILKSETKIIVFAWNRIIMDQIQQANLNYGVSRIDGSTKDADREDAVREFQSGRNRIFLGNIAAAGTGITLTAASVVFFAQSTWTPAELSQAEDRAHRIGQRDNVTVQYMVTEGSIEQNMLMTVLAKMKIAEKVLD